MSANNDDAWAGWPVDSHIEQATERPDIDRMIDLIAAADQEANA